MAECTAVSHLDVATIADNWGEQERALRATGSGEEEGSVTMTSANSKRANVPVYCFCRRPAFGEMIGCDDDACLLEWFHYDCVGLRVAPKSGKVRSRLSGAFRLHLLAHRYQPQYLNCRHPQWFCADCTARRSIEQAKRKLLKRKMAESQMGASIGASSAGTSSEGRHSSGGSRRRDSLKPS